MDDRYCTNAAWDKTEASWRAEAVDSSRRGAASAANALGLKPGECVVVQYHNGITMRPREAFCYDGMLTVGGCIPSPGMIRLTEAVPLSAKPGAI